MVDIIKKKTEPIYKLFSSVKVVIVVVKSECSACVV